MEQTAAFLRYILFFEKYFISVHISEYVYDIRVIPLSLTGEIF